MENTMTSRERVLKAVNFQKPDRIPIDLGGIRASGINAALYDKLKRRMGIHTPTKIHDTMQILAEIDLEVLERLHIDVVPLDACDVLWASMDAEQGVRKKLFCGVDVYFPPDTNIGVENDGSWSLRNTEGSTFARMPKDGFYFDFIRPTMSATRIDPEAFRPLDTVPDKLLEAMANRAAFLHEHTDKAILGWGSCISLMWYRPFVS